MEKTIVVERPLTKVVLNEQHKLLPEQVMLLDERFGKGGWEILPVPSQGWTIREMEEIASALNGEDVVFASPVPALMLMLCRQREVDVSCKVGPPCKIYNVGRIYVFHNDKREKKELPNGKVIMVVAKTGWILF